MPSFSSTSMDAIHGAVPNQKRICVVAPFFQADSNAVSETASSFVEEYAQDGVTHLSVETLPNRLPEMDLLAWHVRKSYDLYKYLRDADFDVVHAPLEGGLAYFSLAAKHQGLALQNTAIILGERKTPTSSCAVDLEALVARALEERCVDLSKRPKLTPQSGNALPMVSVCIVHHNRPQFLRQALDSLAAQTYENFEVVLVDDGSDMAEAQQFLQKLQPEFDSRKWQIVRQPNRYLGAARNNGARHARGDFLMFMDDDNIAMPHEIETFVKVAQRTGADIVTCAMNIFEGSAPEKTPHAIWPYIGSCSTLGIFHNYLGDANALMSKRAFELVGGFSEDYGSTCEDWEFYANALLRGLHIEAIPEPLYWYRSSLTSMVHSTKGSANQLRSLQPYIRQTPKEFRRALALAKGTKWRKECLENYTKEVRARQALIGKQLEEVQSNIQYLHAKAELLACWNSTTWQSSAPLRNFCRRLKGLPEERLPSMQTISETNQALMEVKESFTWRLSAPLRALISRH